jgi:cell division protein FtsI (penicillin-binding protein 3)
MRFRIFVVLLAFLLFFILIIFQAYRLQIVEREKLERLARRQRNKVETLLPKRGIIYDRNGKELAISIDVDSVYCTPNKVKDLRRLSSSLAPILRMSEKEIQNRINTNRGFIWLKRMISPEESDKIKGMGFEEIGIIHEKRRFYPNKALAGHILGFVGVDSQGLEGLERLYDDILKGEPQELIVEKDAHGKIVQVNINSDQKGIEGNNLVLTIDRSIQYLTEQALERAVVKTGAVSGIAIVMNPLNGEILAMANYPSFNPNVFWNFKPDQWRNRAVTDAFEPGSTFKVFMAASAIEEGVARPDTMVFCENGSMSLYGKTIHDHNGHGWLTLSGIIRVSSNIGASKIGIKLGAEKLYRNIQNFGFGKKTGIDLPGENPGILRDFRKWSPIDVATISFGQGISVSAIQLITAFSAIANGGKLITPWVVKEITDSKGNLIRKTEPEIKRIVLSTKTCDLVKSMLRDVVSENGTGKEAGIEGIPVGGKTGTAQKWDRIRGEYQDSAYMSSFIGLVPINEPKVVILVVIDEPKGNPYGGVVAAPTFREIARDVLIEKGILNKEQLLASVERR